MYFALTAPTPMSLADVLSNITTILSSVVSWTNSVINMVTSNPLILTFVLLGVGLIAIGVVRRLIRL